MRHIFVGCAALAMTSPAHAQTLPVPFTDKSHVVCVDQESALGLRAVYEKDVMMGEQLLAHIAGKGLCERTTFSGRPLTDLYPNETASTKPLQLHVFEVLITKGHVLDGRTRAFMLLFILNDNQT